MLKQLKWYYVFVALPYVLLLAGSWLFFEPIKRTILNNPIPHLNYAIIVIILGGGVLILLNCRRLVREAAVMVEFSGAIHAKTDLTTLKEMADGYTGDLACILQMVATSGDRSISHQEQAALEHEVVNSRSRLVRRNALPQYLTGLLVAMGLLGTFIGLLATLADISVLIGSFADIDMANVDPIQVFRVMIERMKAPMSSMGIAFSTSMFGLLGSIIIGLMMLGIRRLQGDIFSVLSSEVARHIEIALSFESISFRDPEAIGVAGETGEFTAKILLRIEERMAESARLRQRSLSTEIDDFKMQRADMLQVLTAQTEASNNFRGELQQLGSQLGNIFSSMEQRNSEISNQISELTVHLNGDAKETHKLLATQVDEQKRLLDTLGSYNIDERLAESARTQQRSLTSVIDDFKVQREEMQQTIAEQTEASKNFRDELQQLGGQLGSIFDSMENGNTEISSQISELTIHMGADAKESHRLLNVTSSNVRGELQQLGNQIGKQLGNLSGVATKGNEDVCHQIVDLKERLIADAAASQHQVEQTSSSLLSELQQLVERLDTLSAATESGNDQVCAQVSELATQLGSEAMATEQKADRFGEDLRSEFHQLGSLLAAISGTAEKGSDAVCEKFSELMNYLLDGTKESHQRLDDARHDVRGELQRLGSQLGTIFGVMEKGSGELASQISELMHHRAVDAKESHKLLAKLLPDIDAMQVNEQEA